VAPFSFFPNQKKNMPKDAFHEKRMKNVRAIERHDSKHLSCITNVYKTEECERLIASSEARGYVPASLYTDNRGKEHFHPDRRKSLRCIIDDEDFATRLLGLIRHAIPETYKGRRFHSINPRLRFLKYAETDDHFAIHTDGHYEDTKKKIRSEITILIYLNHEYEGACTRFYSDSQDKKGEVLVPKTGMVCLMVFDDVTNSICVCAPFR
jgi:hypothetical protein